MKNEHDCLKGGGVGGVRGGGCEAGNSVYMLYGRLVNDRIWKDDIYVRC